MIVLLSHLLCRVIRFRIFPLVSGHVKLRHIKVAVWPEEEEEDGIRNGLFGRIRVTH